MHVAIVGSPRSGNSRCRRYLASAWRLDEYASHDPGLLLAPPEGGGVLQVHATRTDAIERSVRGRGMRVVVTVRHPLDMLLSILHFAQFEDDVRRWPHGDDVVALQGCDPTSEAFRAFATGSAFESLVRVSRSWWGRADAVVRFEHAASDLTSACAALARLDGTRECDTAAAERAAEFGYFHGLPNRHGWQGRAGYWTEFIDRSLARQVEENLGSLMGTYSTRDAQAVDAIDVRLAWAASLDVARPHRSSVRRTAC